MLSGCRGCGSWSHTLRSDVVCPGKHERNWKAQEQQRDHQAQRPVWQLPRRKRSGRQLYHSSRRNDVGRRYAVHLASFYFLEEAAAHNRRPGLGDIIFNGDEIDTKMSGAVPFQEMRVADNEEKTALNFRFVPVDQSLKTGVVSQGFPNRIKF